MCLGMANGGKMPKEKIDGYVSQEAYDQVRWERDTAIEQLKSYGIEFGENADCARVVRCINCKHRSDIVNNSMTCLITGEFVRQDHYCSYGKRRSQ